MRFILPFFLLIQFSLAFAQDDEEQKVKHYILQLNIPESAEDIGKLKFKEKLSDPLQANQELEKILIELRGKGFAGASIDSVVKEGNELTAYLYIGQKFEWLLLRPGNLDEQVLSQVSYKEKFYREKPFRYDQLERLLRQVLAYYENNGYPFAQLRLDSLAMQDNNVEASLQVNKKDLIYFDTLTIKGEDVKIEKGYLYNYLGIKPGEPYDESAIRKISKRIRDLTFLEETESPEVLFVGEKARIILHLRNRKASQFDFLVGFLPNNEVTGRLLITGEANIYLENPFGTGKVIRLNWQKLQDATQNLEVGFEYPYVLGLPLGTNFEMELYKRDTQYIDIQYTLGVRYLLDGRNYFEGFYNGQITNLIKVDTNLIKSNRSLPPNVDVRNSFYGAKYHFENLNYRINPTSGWVFELSGAAGTKRVKKNLTIAQISDPENPGETLEHLYDSLSDNRLQLKAHYILEKYWPIGGRSTVKTAVRGAAIYGENLFISELFRIGGTKILRGFDEEDLFTSLYNVLTLEYRFLLSVNSYFSLFFDGAYVEQRLKDSFTSDFPFGFGAGLSFETGVGLFNVSYALGRQQQNKIDFRSAKIHFGYINYF
ncbi:MAG: hypothetical protein WD048_12540 [Chitinophagales bacterium]